MSVSIDSRGPRWSALITTIVLATALVTSSLWVIAYQAVVFAIGAIRGPQFTPNAVIFKKIIRPRLKSEVTFEDVRPPQFAQAVGLVFALIAVIASVVGAGGVFTIAVGFALAAAFLNAAFNFCLGCEMYLLILRARTAK
ncbi:hypothetical protein GM50_14645 [freshwater metagenome]|uniref:DUF4395 domain-containing protein n=1 Tax=freshwater metagenome TaxID=449393 RepID=A0A094PZ73_9ZZZZ